jgi:hypothetical protein
MTFKVKVVPILSTDTIIFELGATLQGTMHGLIFCNNMSSARTLTLKLFDASENVTSIIAIKEIEANSQFTWPRPIDLESGDAVVATGADLIALHSTYIGSSTPPAQGFTGRGAWSDSATYQINDVVSFQGSSYVSNAVNINSEPPSADWTLLAEKGQNGNLEIIRTPVAISPTTGGVNPSPSGPLVATPYAPIYSADTRDYREFEVADPADSAFASPVFAIQINADSTNISPPLSVSTNYIWRCKDVSVTNIESDWMATQSFTTESLTVDTPTVTVAGQFFDVEQTPQITTSAYATTPPSADVHFSTDWEVRLTSNNNLVWSSYNDTANLLTISVPPQILQTSTSYKFRARHNSAIYGSSAYGEVQATTKATFADLLYSRFNTFDERSVGIGTLVLEPLSFLDADTAIYAYAPRVGSLTTGMNLYVSLVKRVSGNFVQDLSTEVLVTANNDTTGTFGVRFVVCANSATNGIIFWQGLSPQAGVYATAFEIVGGAIVLAAATQLSTNTTNGLFGAWWQTSGKLVAAYFSSASTVPVFRVLDLAGSGITLGAERTFTFTYPTATTPIRLSAVPLTSTLSAVVFSANATSTNNRSIQLARVTVSGTNVTVNTPLNISTSTTASTVPLPPTLCALSTTRVLVAWDTIAAGNQAARFVTVSGFDTGTLVAATVFNAKFQSGSTGAYRRGLFRISNTEAFLAEINGVYAVNIDGSTGDITSEAATVSLQDLGTVTNGSGIYKTPLGPQPLVSTAITEFVRFGSPGTAGVSFTLDSRNMNVFTAGSLIPGVTYGYLASFNAAVWPLYTTISRDRTLVVSQIDGSEYSKQAQFSITLLDTSGTVPSKIWTEKLERVTGTATQSFSVVALSTSRAILYDSNVFKLLSISDLGLSVLDTQNVFAGWPAGNPASMVQLDSSRAVANTVFSSSSYVVMLSVSADVLTVGSSIQVSSTLDAVSFPCIAALSGSRALVLWRRASIGIRGTILDISGTSISLVAQETTILADTNFPNIWFSLTPFDTGRYLWSYVTNSANVNLTVLVDTGSGITVGTTRSTAVRAANVTGQFGTIMLSTTRGLLLRHDGATTNNLLLDGFTVGAGAAQPSATTNLATVQTSADTFNYWLDLSRLAPLNSPTSSETGAIVWQSTSNVNTGGFYTSRKFVRSPP